jgi:uncharacterized repeat protein (TIGR02543 family)
VLGSTSNIFGTLEVAGLTVKAGAAGALPSAAILSIGSAYSPVGTFDLNGYNQTVSQLKRGTTGGYGTNRIVTSTLPATLTMNGSSSPTYDGLLTGALGLTKSGSSTLALSAANTYSGDTTVSGGTLLVNAGSSLGYSTNILVTGGILELKTSTGVADGATVAINSGAKVKLNAGVNEAVNRLVLNGVLQGAGVWGATNSGAAHISDTYFTGTGTLTVNAGAASGVEIVQTDGATAVSEGGASDTYTVVLKTSPAADVTVSVRAGDQLMVSTTNLVFTGANWSTPQTVTVAAIDDAVSEGAHSARVTHAAASADAAYDAITVADVEVSVTDNDPQSLIVSANAVAVPEGGAADFTVRLAYQPASGVFVSNAWASGDADLGVSAGLTFTTSNWNTAQSVTLYAAEDDADIANGVAWFVSSASGCASATVTVTEADDDFVLAVNSSGSGTASGGGLKDRDNAPYTLSASAGPGSVFLCWSGPDAGSVADTNAASTTIRVSAAASVTANFKALTLCAVTFDPQGGTVSPASLTVTNGYAYGSLPAPSWPGHTFGGWYTGAGGAGIRVESGTVVTGTANHSLFAKWSGNGVSYLVIELSGGPNATNYPVTYLDAVPPGGWTDAYKTDKLVLRKIPAGAFTMGSPTNEAGRFENETPHSVTLTAGYHIGVFEVSQRQWERVMGSRPSVFTNEACYATRPVEQVSYDDVRSDLARAGDPAAEWPASGAAGADTFVGRLRAKTGLATLDLPTEAQWEYACRAGTVSALYSGAELTGEETCTNVAALARYLHNGGAGYAPWCGPEAGTARVGSYAPNAWGLYDLCGNVMEWCLDWYGDYPGGAAVDPKGAEPPASERLVRGGSWFDIAAYCRSANRDNQGPSSRYSVIGLRLARTLPANLFSMTVAGGTGGGEYAAGSAVAITAVAPAGQAFVRWTVSPADAALGAGLSELQASFTVIAPEHDVTLSAVFESIVSQVTFDAQGGSISQADATVTNGLPYGALPTPAKEGHSFAGWYTEAGGTGTQVLANTLVTATANHTLYAKWIINAFTLTVSSEHGGAQPGAVTADWGTALSQWVTNSPVMSGTTQYVCVGASVAGNAFTLAGPTHVILTLTNNATLTWLWTTNFWFGRAAGLNGTVSGSTNGWYAAGSRVSIAATGDNAYRFSTWTGDVPAEHALDNPLALSLDHARAVVAQFARITLAEVLDCLSLTWTTGGQAGWWGQTVASHDGFSAAQAGAIGDRQTSWVRTTVNGSGRLTFWWKVSSEAGYDFLRFKVNGVTWREISGESGWQLVALRIEDAGLHTLEWNYTKDKDTAEGLDTGWVDQFIWSPDAQVTSHGTPYSWLDQHGLASGGNYEAADTDDVDGDGFEAWQEYIAGTDPMSAASAFKATVRLTEGQRSIHWTPDLTNAVPVRVYSVYGVSNLLEVFPVTPVTNVPAGTLVPVQSLEQLRFFRIGVGLQP